MALLCRGDRDARSNATAANNRISPFFKGFAAVNVTAEPAVYSDQRRTIRSQTRSEAQNFGEAKCLKLGGFSFRVVAKSFIGKRVKFTAFTSRSIWRSHAVASNSANHCGNSARSSAERPETPLLEGFEFVHRKNTTFSFHRRRVPSREQAVQSS
jgi:hypothetical protein